MNKIEAKELMGEFLNDCDKTTNGTKTPLRKAFDIAYQELCNSDPKIFIKQEEVDLILSAIIVSPVNVPKDLEDRLLKLLNEIALPF